MSEPSTNSQHSQNFRDIHTSIQALSKTVNVSTDVPDVSLRSCVMSLPDCFPTSLERYIQLQIDV